MNLKKIKMFTHIKTSKENREVVAQLTRKLNLGTENIISRIALTHSLSLDRKLDLSEIQNSGGKEYSKKVLFGDYADFYLSMVALHYNLHISDKFFVLECAIVTVAFSFNNRGIKGLPTILDLPIIKAFFPVIS